MELPRHHAGLAGATLVNLEVPDAGLNNLNISTYWAETRSGRVDVGDDQSSQRVQLDYTGDRYGVQLERLAVGDDFRPEIGFLRRDDFDDVEVG